MRSCSNSANAPKIWKMSLPPGVVVSICSYNLQKPTSPCCSSVIVSIRWRSERPKRIELTDDESVAWSQLVENLAQLRSLVEGRWPYRRRSDNRRGP